MLSLQKNNHYLLLLINIYWSIQFDVLPIICYYVETWLFIIIRVENIDWYVKFYLEFWGKFLKSNNSDWCDWSDVVLIVVMYTDWCFYFEEAYWCDVFCKMISKQLFLLIVWLVWKDIVVPIWIWNVIVLFEAVEDYN